MSRLAWLLLASLAPGGCVSATCVGEQNEQTLDSADATAFAWHARAAWEYYAHVSGTLSNRSATQDCTAAFYRFTREPTPADIPALIIGEPAPELPDAELLAQFALPHATAAHSFSVPTDLVQIGDGAPTQPPLDEWIVVALCADAEVDLALTFDMTLCRDGRREPEYESPLVERLW
jgi:hypothetical protein